MVTTFYATVVLFSFGIWVAVGHPEYLKDCPALTESYFSQFGVGAVGHDGGRAGASLNPFGESFKHGKSQNCGVLDGDDDDDDDDHHHSWGTKLCCADSDGDGLTNGAELGDPCCEWKKGRALPWDNYKVSHPGMASEVTSERRECDGILHHRKPPCSPYPPGPAPPQPSPAPSPGPGPAPSPKPSKNECNPDKKCNVCTACCKSYIGDGKECDDCVRAECAPSYECQPSKSCNVCTACCKTYIQDGEECNNCVKKECNSSHIPQVAHQRLYVQGFNARRILQATGQWRQTTNLSNADLIWVRNKCVLEDYLGWRGQAVNILDSDKVISNKVMLQRLMDSLPRSDRSFYPETILLTNQNDLTALEQRFNHTNLNNNNVNEDVWILKPADLSKGIGVVPIPSPAAWIREGGHRHALGSGRSHVLQRYIEQPMLVNGFKSEIRLYFLVASVQPLRVLWYPQGSVRLAVRPFARSQWEDPLVHIVNTAQGKRSLGERKYAELSRHTPRKLSFAELDSYLENNSTRNPNPNPNTATKSGNAWKHILSQMLRAVQTVMHAAAPSLERQTDDRVAKWHSFALMGADFIVDRDLKVWMTEVQEGPGLSHIGEKVKQDFVPAMVSEAARIGLKVASLKTKGGSIRNLEQGTNFRPLI